MASKGREQAHLKAILLGLHLPALILSVTGRAASSGSGQLQSFSLAPGLSRKVTAQRVKASERNHIAGEGTAKQLQTHLFSKPWFQDGQAAPVACALLPSEGAPSSGRPTLPPGAPPDGYQDLVLGAQPTQAQKLPPVLAALTANNGPLHSLAGVQMSDGAGQARGQGQSWNGQPLAPQMLPQRSLPQREVVASGQGLPDQAPRMHHTPDHLSGAPLPSRPLSAGDAAAQEPFSAQGSSYHVNLQIPELDVSSGRANGAPTTSDRHRSSFEGFWSGAPRNPSPLPQLEGTAAAPQWPQASLAESFLLLQSRVQGRQPPTAFPQPQHAAPFMLSNNWQMAERQQHSLGGMAPPQPPHQQQHAQEELSGAFPPVQQPHQAHAPRPFRSWPAGQHLQEASEIRLPPPGSAQYQQQPSADGQVWRRERPAAAADASLPSGGVPAPRRPPQPQQPDAQWLQSLPSLRDMVQRAPGVSTAEGMMRRPQTAPPPAGADWTSGRPRSASDGDSASLASHGSLEGFHWRTPSPCTRQQLPSANSGPLTAGTYHVGRGHVGQISAVQDSLKHGGDTSIFNAGSTLPQQPVPSKAQSTSAAPVNHKSAAQHPSVAEGDPSARSSAAQHARPAVAAHLQQPVQTWTELSSLEAASRETANHASAHSSTGAHGYGTAAGTAAPLAAADEKVQGRPDQASAPVAPAASAREGSAEAEIPAERQRPSAHETPGGAADAAGPAADLPGHAASAELSNRDGLPLPTQLGGAAEVLKQADVTAIARRFSREEAAGPGRPVLQSQASAELPSLAGPGPASTQEEAAETRLEAAAARLSPQPQTAVNSPGLAGPVPASAHEEAAGARPEAAAARLQLRPPAAAACESERGGVPGESPEQRATFLESLQRHWEREAREDFVQNRWALPVTGHKQVDLPALYRQVGLHGGYDLVSEKKWWRNIGTLLGHAPSSKMKAIYEKFLLSYAQRYYDASRFAKTAAPLYLRASTIKAQERELMEQFRPQQEKASRPGVLTNGMVQPQRPLPNNHTGNQQVWRPMGLQAAQHQQQQQQQQYQQQQQPHVHSSQLLHVKNYLAERQAYAHRQAALQQSQLEQLRHAALNRLSPSPSPFLLVPQTLAPQQVQELVMALKSGLPDLVPWALNALAVSSFVPRPGLPTLPSLPGLLPALLQVLQSAVEDPTDTAAAVAAANAALTEDEWPGLRPPRKRQKGTPPGEPQGWWWERAGLLSDGGAEDERFGWGVCAAAILRNLATVRANLGALSDPDCISLLVECLEARNKERSAGYNEMALSILDIVSAVAGGGCFSAQHHTASLIRLVKALSQLLSQRHPGDDAPLKLRAAAAEALGKLAASRQLAPVMLPCIELAELRLTGHLVDLLLVDLEAAREAVRGEVGGDLGTPAVAPCDVSPEALQHAAVVAQAEAVAAAAVALTAVAALAALRRGGATVWDSDARAVPALVATALGQHPAVPPGPPGSASGLPTGALAAHTAALLKRAAEHACAALWHTAGTLPGRQQLSPFVGELAPAAMSNHPHSSYLAQLLARLS
ncbi:g9305 [Coccomyxa elongata]